MSRSKKKDPHQDLVKLFKQVSKQLFACLGSRRRKDVDDRGCHCLSSYTSGGLLKEEYKRMEGWQADENKAVKDYSLDSQVCDQKR